MSIEPITIPMSIEANEVTIDSTFDARIEVVEGGSITVESLSVNTNGTTTAPTGKAYSPVVVNVPNTYTNADEGKVVKNGALTSQTSTTKNANGTYDTTTNNQVTVAVPASAVDTGTKNITSNGNNQDVVGYAKVNVNVPNSYSASDEGKVVSSGALVSQTSDTVTTNDTYDTTLINSLTVNVSGGGTDYLAQRVTNTLTSYSNSDITSINQFSFRACSNLISCDVPNVATVSDAGFYGCTGLTHMFFNDLHNLGQNAFYGCNKLETIVSKKALYCNGGSEFNGCSKLSAVDMGTGSGRFAGSGFASCAALKTIVIRSDSVATLASTNTFTGTPFASSGSGGTLYVPQSKISNYTGASNWSTILGYTNNQIKSIESTHTDPNAPIDLTLYYADSTPIS